MHLELVVDLQRNMVLSMNGRREVVEACVLVCAFRVGPGYETIRNEEGKGRTLDDFALLEEYDPFVLRVCIGVVRVGLEREFGRVLEFGRRRWRRGGCFGECDAVQITAVSIDMADGRAWA